MTETMLAKMACAISGAPFPSAKSLAKARAALEAIREPDVPMDLWDAHDWPAFTTMIDAILSQSQEGK